MSKLSDVIVGGPVIFNPAFLGEVLKGSCFYMSYNSKELSAELFHNTGQTGGRIMMIIKNMSHESAVKLAKGMGLKPDREGGDCCFWSRSVPIIHLYHDGSEDAEKIRLEACRLNIECITVKINKRPWYLINGMYRYDPTTWPADKLIIEMKHWAKDLWKIKGWVDDSVSVSA